MAAAKDISVDKAAALAAVFSLKEEHKDIVSLYSTDFGKTLVQHCGAQRLAVAVSPSRQKEALRRQ